MVQTYLGAKVIQSANYLPNLMLCLSFAKSSYMKSIVWILAIVVLVFSIYWFKFRTVNGVESAKTAPLKAGRNSLIFNSSIDTLMTAYFDLKTAFVEADSIMAKTAAQKFSIVAGGIKLDELKKDSAGIAESAVMQLNDIRSNTESLIKQPNLKEMRQDFRMVSESIYPFLKTIHYSGPTLYWQNCPMAFGEGKEAAWISNTAEIVNPYLGKKDPEFRASMLHCGETKDSIVAR